MELYICERCGLVYDQKIDFCLACRGKVLPLGITEEEANSTYQVEGDDYKSLSIRNEKIREDYFYGKIENKNGEDAISKEDLKELLGENCPRCNGKNIWSLRDRKYCRMCGYKW